MGKKMNCKEICELLSAYLDGEVTPEEKAYIEAHLHDCPQCRAELEALSAIQKDLRNALKSMADEATPSPQVWNKIRVRLATGKSRRGFWTNFTLRRVATAATAIVVLALAVVVWQFIGSFKMGSPSTATSPGMATPRTTVSSTSIPMPSEMVMFERLPDIISAYGESVDIEMALTNEASEPLIVSPYSPEIKIIKLPDLQSPDTVVRTFSAGRNELELPPGESASYLLKWDQKNDSGQQVPPGWYGIEVTVASKETIDATGGHVRGLATRVLVLPPQGVMEKTIEVNKSRTVTGLPFVWGEEEQNIMVTITLERAEMTADSVGFTVLITSPAYIPPPGTGLTQPQWILEAYAHYTVDGVTKDAGVAGMRPLEDGLQLQWGYEPEYIDPIPGDAKELTFTITKLGVWEGHWEFTIQLE